MIVKFKLPSPFFLHNELLHIVRHKVGSLLRFYYCSSCGRHHGSEPRRFRRFLWTCSDWSCRRRCSRCRSAVFSFADQTLLPMLLLLLLLLLLLMNAWKCFKVQFVGILLNLLHLWVVLLHGHISGKISLEGCWSLFTWGNESESQL